MTLAGGFGGLNPLYNSHPSHLLPLHSHPPSLLLSSTALTTPTTLSTSFTSSSSDAPKPGEVAARPAEKSDGSAPGQKEDKSVSLLASASSPSGSSSHLPAAPQLPPLLAMTDIGRIKAHTPNERPDIEKDSLGNNLAKFSWKTNQQIENHKFLNQLFTHHSFPQRISY